MEHLLEVQVKTLVLRDDQVVLKDSLDEVLTGEKILELLEVNGILGGLHLEGVDQGLKLMVRVDTSFLDLVEELMLEEVPTILTVQGLKCTACPGGGCVLAWHLSDWGHLRDATGCVSVEALESVTTQLLRLPLL